MVCFIFLSLCLAYLYLYPALCKSRKYHPSQYIMASTATKKIVVAGGNGFLGKAIAILLPTSPSNNLSYGSH